MSVRLNLTQEINFRVGRKNTPGVHEHTIRLSPRFAPTDRGRKASKTLGPGATLLFLLSVCSALSRWKGATLGATLGGFAPIFNAKTSEEPRHLPPNSDVGGIYGIPFGTSGFNTPSRSHLRS